MYGTKPDAPKLVVAAEPRNRECRFDAINEFADDLDAYVRPHFALRTEPKKKGGGFRQVASSAPQVVVPNRATRSYLGSRLGRSLRYLGFDGTHEVPEATKWAGSHLSWLSEHANLPGQATFLAMTETLSEHFVTGQSALEDESLAALLAWIDGVAGDLLPELERIELEEAFGPVPNPKWEATLEPFVKAWGDGRRAEDEAKMAAAAGRVTDVSPRSPGGGVRRDPPLHRHPARHRPCRVRRRPMGERRVRVGRARPASEDRHPDVRAPPRRVACGSVTAAVERRRRRARDRDGVRRPDDHGAARRRRPVRHRRDLRRRRSEQGGEARQPARDARSPRRAGPDRLDPTTRGGEGALGRRQEDQGRAFVPWTTRRRSLRSPNRSRRSTATHGRSESK